LEASEKGSEVRLNCKLINGDALFSVWNDTVIPREVQAQLWQRSFSTKGENRGIGTYSMKLFTEQYLGGKISFTSGEGEGTTFTVSLPL
jgi:signal transduction histidine kinase